MSSILAGGEVDWIGFAFAVLLIELTPGPNMAWLVGMTLTKGLRTGLVATAGIAIGLLLNAVLAAWGLAELIAAHHAMQNILRIAGGLVLLALAWEAWRDEGGGRSVGREGFWAGLLLNLLNPKAFLFFVVVAPPFLNGQTLTMRHAMAMALLSVTIATAVHLALVMSAAQASSFVSDPARTRTLRRTMAVAMVGVAIWMALG